MNRTQEPKRRLGYPTLLLILLAVGGSGWLLFTALGGTWGGGDTTDTGPALGESGQDEEFEAALAEPEVAAVAMGLARAALFDTPAPDRNALADLPGRRAFVCAYQEKPTRLCATGTGVDLAASIEAAAAALKEQAGRKIDPANSASIRLKLDLVTHVKDRTFSKSHDKPKARRVGTYGYYVGTDNGQASWLLPSELLERGLYDKKKGFDRGKIGKQLFKRNGQLGELPDEFPYQEIRTIAWVERDQPGPQDPGGSPPGVFRLYRLHPYEFAEATPPVMLQRLVWAADYLMSSISKDGKIRYNYKTATDKDSRSYNLLRHGGTTYSLLQVYDRTRFEPYLLASVQAMHYLFDHCDRDERTGPWLPADHASYGESMYIVSPPDKNAPQGKVKLGGAGLALVMIDQYVEATGDTLTYREQAMGLARFLVASQKKDGEFLYFPPRHPGGELTDTDDSPYYPGEAIYGLVRLYSWDPNPLWLETAVRGADWLIDERDAGKGASSLENDHWLMLALSFLYKYTEDSRYLDHSIALCRAVEHQYLKNEKFWEDYPDFRGGYYNPPRSTPAATRGEGLGAVLETCELAGQDCGWIEELLMETVRHEMLSQYDPDMSFWMANRAKSFGGWNGGLLDMDIRNDFVQHNMSSALGAERHLLRNDGVVVPGGPGWMEQRLAGKEFAGIPGDQLASLREASLRYRGETYWEELAVDSDPAKEEDVN